MNYTEKLEAIKTVKELYQFRDELLKILIDNGSDVGNKIDWSRVEICQNANFFKDGFKKELNTLNQKGYFLTVSSFQNRQPPTLRLTTISL